MAGMPLLLIAFITVPIIELVVIGQVEDVLGWPVTIALLILDSVIGAVLVRRESRRTWHAFREALGAGRWPGDEVAQGALVLIGGALLVTPGFVTDVAGLMLVVPPTRAVLARLIRARFTPAPVRAFQQATGGPSERGPRRSAGRRPSPPGTSDPGVVDVEVVSVERDDDAPTGERGS
jgi:UPF0716 protein FxsA